MTRFTISLQVHHVSRDLHFLTAAMATQPAFCMTAGEQAGSVQRKTSVWHAPLFQGTTQQHFDLALEELLRFLKEQENTLAAFAGDDAMVEVIFSFGVAASDARAGALAHSVNLVPRLLYELASRQIGVKVQTFYNEEESR